MPHSYLLFVLAVALAITSTYGATDPEKRTICRKPSFIRDIDETRFLGHWYEYSRHHHDFENGCDCLTSEISAVGKDTFQISNCCQMTRVSNETQTCNIGINEVKFMDPEKKEGYFRYMRTGCKYLCIFFWSLQFFNWSLYIATVESHIWIVDTDYENYLIASGCDRLSNEEEREIFWILSRNKEISAAEVTKIDEVLTAHKFERNKIIKQRHGVNV